MSKDILGGYLILEQCSNKKYAPFNSRQTHSDSLCKLGISVQMYSKGKVYNFDYVPPESVTIVHQAPLGSVCTTAEKKITPSAILSPIGRIDATRGKENTTNASQLPIGQINETTRKENTTVASRSHLVTLGTQNTFDKILSNTAYVPSFVTSHSLEDSFETNEHVSMLTKHTSVSEADHAVGNGNNNKVLNQFNSIKDSQPTTCTLPVITDNEAVENESLKSIDISADIVEAGLENKDMCEKKPLTSTSVVYLNNHNVYMDTSEAVNSDDQLHRLEGSVFRDNMQLDQNMSCNNIGSNKCSNKKYAPINSRQTHSDSLCKLGISVQMYSKGKVYNFDYVPPESVTIDRQAPLVSVCTTAEKKITPSAILSPIGRIDTTRGKENITNASQLPIGQIDETTRKENTTVASRSHLVTLGTQHTFDKIPSNMAYVASFVTNHSLVDSFETNEHVSTLTKHTSVSEADHAVGNGNNNKVLNQFNSIKHSQPTTGTLPVITDNEVVEIESLKRIDISADIVEAGLENKDMCEEKALTSTSVVYLNNHNVHMDTSEAVNSDGQLHRLEGSVFRENMQLDQNMSCNTIRSNKSNGTSYKAISRENILGNMYSPTNIESEHFKVKDADKQHNMTVINERNGINHAITENESDVSMQNNNYEEDIGRLDIYTSKPILGEKHESVNQEKAHAVAPNSNSDVDIVDEDKYSQNKDPVGPLVALECDDVFQDVVVYDSKILNQSSKKSEIHVNIREKQPPNSKAMKLNATMSDSQDSDNMCFQFSKSIFTFFQKTEILQIQCNFCTLILSHAEYFVHLRSHRLHSEYTQSFQEKVRTLRNYLESISRDAKHVNVSNELIGPHGYTYCGFDVKHGHGLVHVVVVCKGCCKEFHRKDFIEHVTHCYIRHGIDVTRDFLSRLDIFKETVPIFTNMQKERLPGDDTKQKKIKNENHMNDEVTLVLHNKSIINMLNVDNEMQTSTSENEFDWCMQVDDDYEEETDDADASATIQIESQASVNNVDGVEFVASYDTIEMHNDVSIVDITGEHNYCQKEEQSEEHLVAIQRDWSVYLNADYVGDTVTNSELLNNDNVPENNSSMPKNNDSMPSQSCEERVIHNTTKDREASVSNTYHIHINNEEHNRVSNIEHKNCEFNVKDTGSFMCYGCNNKFDGTAFIGHVTHCYIRHGIDVTGDFLDILDAFKEAVRLSLNVPAVKKQIHEKAVLEEPDANKRQSYREKFREFKNKNQSLFKESLSQFMKEFEKDMNQVPCHECGKRINKTYMETHLKKQHSPDKYPCEVCGHLYCNAQALEQHVKVKHKSTPGCHPCKLCKKEFTSEQSMQGHSYSVHFKRKIYKCSKCSKKFKSPHWLQTHLVVHEEVRPYGCNVCEASFKRKDHLRVHIDTQHNIKVFWVCSAPDCDVRRFTRKHELECHLQMKHIADTFPCPDCPEKFRMLPNLNRHRAWKHGKKEKLSAAQFGYGEREVADYGMDGVTQLKTILIHEDELNVTGNVPSQRIYVVWTEKEKKLLVNEIRSFIESNTKPPRHIIKQIGLKLGGTKTYQQIYSRIYSIINSKTKVLTGVDDSNTSFSEQTNVALQNRFWTEEENKLLVGVIRSYIESSTMPPGHINDIIKEIHDKLDGARTYHEIYAKVNDFHMGKTKLPDVEVPKIACSRPQGKVYKEKETIICKMSDTEEQAYESSPNNDVYTSVVEFTASKMDILQNLNRPNTQNIARMTTQFDKANGEMDRLESEQSDGLVGNAFPDTVDSSVEHSNMKGDSIVPTNNITRLLKRKSIDSEVNKLKIQHNSMLEDKLQANIDTSSDRSVFDDKLHANNEAHTDNLIEYKSRRQGLRTRRQVSMKVREQKAALSSMKMMTQKSCHKSKFINAVQVNQNDHSKPGVAHNEFECNDKDGLPCKVIENERGKHYSQKDDDLMNNTVTDLEMGIEEPMDANDELSNEDEVPNPKRLRTQEMTQDNGEIIDTDQNIENNTDQNMGDNTENIENNTDQNIGDNTDPNLEDYTVQNMGGNKNQNMEYNAVQNIGDNPFIRKVDQIKMQAWMMEIRTYSNSCKIEYICCICDAYFKSKKPLSIHMYCHIDTDPDRLLAYKHKCEKCGNWFKTPGELKNHTDEVHEGSRPHRCTVCQRDFASCRQIQRHVKRNHSNPELQHIKMVKGKNWTFG